MDRSLWARHLSDSELGIYVAVGAGTEGVQGAGNFARIDNYDACTRNVRAAGRLISTRISPARADLFASPNGVPSDYLTRSTNRWLVPRFVCGA